MDDIIILVTATDKRTQVADMVNLVVNHFKAKKKDSLTCRKATNTKKSVKILKVVIDNTLNFRQHVEYQAAKRKQL